MVSSLRLGQLAAMVNRAWKPNCHLPQPSCIAAYKFDWHCRCTIQASSICCCLMRCRMMSCMMHDTCAEPCDQSTLSSRLIHACHASCIWLQIRQPSYMFNCLLCCGRNLFHNPEYRVSTSLLLLHTYDHTRLHMYVQSSPSATAASLELHAI